MHCRVLKLASWYFSIALLLSAPIALSAQASESAKGDNSSNQYASRWDIFAGYSYLAPKGTVNVPQPNGSVAPYSYDAVNVGGLFSGAYFFNRYAGAQIEFAEHNWGTQSSNGSNIGTHGNNDGFDTIGGGIIFRFPTGNITPFLHGLIDAERVGGPDFNPYKWGPGLTLGGGMDYETPLFNHHLAIRLFQADYEYMHADFGQQANPPGGRANINAARLSAGVVFHVGSIAPPAPVTLGCAANPDSVYPGTDVAITATPGNLNPKMNATYSYSGSGVQGNGASATVNTASLAPGNYTVNCDVKEGRKGKEGQKAWEAATASANFTVKPFEPPTISCSANPATIKPGETSTISATGVSPQNLPLSYNYSASTGNITGNGATAVYSSTGAPAGSVSVNCKVSDDKGNTASADTTVTIEAPPPPPPQPSPEQKRLEARLALHSVFFPTNEPTPSRPEGGLLQSQQGTLTTLATDFKNYLAMKPDARLTLTGHADVRGSAEYNQALTQRRVDRVKQFLVQQGVPEGSIDVRAEGKENQLSADQVRALVEQNPDLSDAQRAKVLRSLNVIVLAQNRRVDITLSTTGQQSVQLYPFNAADSATLLERRAPAPRKKTRTKR
ncbi:MAG TPA: OmpA family protein [Terracidiphilus sp.]|nr:OmpA family protein [Terracidiphilus sp.]